jgi:hypothetical protein
VSAAFSIHHSALCDRVYCLCLQLGSLQLQVLLESFISNEIDDMSHLLQPQPSYQLLKTTSLSQP